MQTAFHAYIQARRLESEISEKVVVKAYMGLTGIHKSSSRSAPKGVLFFVGPTGVGKTELSKALAKFLFGDEQACIRFDMSEYAQENSDQKLIGAPPGYVGYEEGGQLTNTVKEKPFSIILFDEISNIVPFHFIKDRDFTVKIAKSKLRPVQKAVLEKYRIDLIFEDELRFIDYILGGADSSKGGRDILNAINDKLLDELAMFMFENKQDLSSFKGAKIVVGVAKDKLYFEFDND